MLTKAETIELKLKQELHQSRHREIELSDEGKKYEPIYLKYIEDMRKLGKSWKSARTTLLAKKLGMPLDYLKEIKKKYCPKSEE